MRQLVKDTAKAWGISKRQTNNLYNWVEKHIPDHRRSRVLTILLRKNMNSNK